MLRGDEWWGAVLDRDVHIALSDACEASRVELHGIVAEEALAQVGVEATLDAAAPLERGVLPGVIDPEKDSRALRSARRSRLTLLACAVLSFGAAAFAPTFVYRTNARVLASRTSAALAAQRSTAGSNDDVRARALLEGIASLRRGREAASVIFARLAAALPESARLVSFDLDTSSAKVTILAPVDVDVVGALARVQGLGDPRIRGAITRERLAGAEVHRTSLELPRDLRRQRSIEMLVRR